MKVKDLIKKLEQLNPELHVFIHGYEGGYSEVESISEEEEFALNVHSEWYYGSHELAKDKMYVPDKSKYKIVNGIIL